MSIPPIRIHSLSFSLFFHSIELRFISRSLLCALRPFWHRIIPCCMSRTQKGNGERARARFHSSGEPEPCLGAHSFSFVCVAEKNGIRDTTITGKKCAQAKTTTMPTNSFVTRAAHLIHATMRSHSSNVRLLILAFCSSCGGTATL